MTDKIRVPQITRDKCQHARPGLAETSVPVPPEIKAMGLVHKMYSEVGEIADDLTNAEEYADLFEAMLSLAGMMGVTWHEIQQAMRDKHDRKGGFDKGLLWTADAFVVATEGDHAQVAA